MLRVRDLAELASRTTPDEFADELGPFLLIERPPQSVFANVATALVASRTVGMAMRSRMADEILAMVLRFSGLRVQPLPSLAQPRELSVGRADECDVVVRDPSVSKRHAVLRWEPRTVTCTVKDVGSTNGTFVNASDLAGLETELYDGDTIAFGDALFFFMLSPTLHAQLRSVPLPPVALAV